MSATQCSFLLAVFLGLKLLKGIERAQQLTAGLEPGQRALVYEDVSNAIKSCCIIVVTSTGTSLALQDSEVSAPLSLSSMSSHNPHVPRGHIVEIKIRGTEHFLEKDRIMYK